MNAQRREVAVDRQFDEVVAVLRAKPARWLASFLRLATHRQVAHTVAYVDVMPWYRLRDPVVRDGVAEIGFVWWPHLDEHVFTSFRGSFRVTREGTGSRLGLEGDVVGGHPEQSAMVLDQLLQLIRAALEADQSPA